MLSYTQLFLLFGLAMLLILPLLGFMNTHAMAAKRHDDIAH